MQTKQTSRLLSILLSLVMVVGLLPTGLFSLTAYASTGNGWEEDPYIVTTYDDLLDKVTGNGDFYKTYIKLGADIIQEDNLTDLMITPGNRAHIVLDLNGHTLSRTCRSVDVALFYIGSAVYLTIDDSSEGKTGSASFLNEARDGCLFVNAGYLTINGGNYETNKRTNEIMYVNSSGTTEINGGVFKCYNDDLYSTDNDAWTPSPLTDNYPVLFITGGEFYCTQWEKTNTIPERSLVVYLPTFITGGKFINPAPNGNFAHNMRDYELIYCGGTFRPKNYFMGGYIYKVPGTFSATTTIDGLDYAMNAEPVVITDGSESGTMSVNSRLISKCLQLFREHVANYSTSKNERFNERYPRLLDDSYPDIPVITRSDRTAPELSIQYRKTIRNTMQWYQSTDGINFTEIPNTAGKQTITPPSVLSACTMYYRCNYVSNPGVASSDTIKVVYQATPVSAVNITGLDKPVADQPADFTADETVAYSVSKISWYDPYEGMYLAADEPAIGNHTYRGSFRLKPKEGFRFTADTSVDVSVFGYYNLTTTLAENGDLVVYFNVWIDFFYVKEFNIINLTTPVAGQHPDFTADSADGKINVTKVEWVQQFDDFLTLTETDTFDAGKDYQCFIYFEGNEDAGYWLNNSDLTATINGVPNTYWYQINHTAGQNTAWVYEIYTATGTVSGNTVSGSITSFGDASENTKIELIKGGASLPSYSATGKTSYSITGVAPGDYTVKVSKKNHVTREYEINVSGSAVTQDVEIWLLGDADLGGQVNIKDATAIQKYVASLINFTEQQLLHADMDADSNINIKDATAIQKSIAGIV